MGLVMPRTSVDLAHVAGGDPWDDTDDTETTYATGVRASIDAPSGTEADQTQEAVQYRLLCDPTPDLVHTDVVIDRTTELRYQVVWVAHVQGVLAHTKAGLRRQTGGARGQVR